MENHSKRKLVANDLGMAELDLPELNIDVSEATQGNFTQLCRISRQQWRRINDLEIIHDEILSKYCSEEQKAIERIYKAGLQYEETNRRRYQEETRRIQLENQVDELQARIAELEQEQAGSLIQIARVKRKTEPFVCSICVECLVDVILPCYHVFCHRCVNDWMEFRKKGDDDDSDTEFAFIDENHAVETSTFSCPTCRAKVSDHEVRALYLQS